MTALDVVVMAAGKGTRMKSRLPKVLHRLAGRALIQHVMDTAAGLQARSTVVITGHGAAEVEAALGKSASFARQEPQLGTGHAMQQAAPLLPDDGTTLILNGDVPLIELPTLLQVVESCDGKRLALLTVDMPDPTGYGRIIRSGEQVRAIVEHKDASEQQRQVREIYTGVMAVEAPLLNAWQRHLTTDK
jgi:bifunctional UDP-N-acetylglucosamine pyrophosphorylase/glucosamine-1-phosphate N-acetyltransferase